MTKYKYLVGIFLGASTLVTPFVSAAAMPADQCSEAVLLSYFPEEFVREMLEKFESPQGSRDAIVKDLALKDAMVISTVEEKASKMNPNPLTDPNLRDEAVKIFRETLYELFADVMKTQGVTDPTQLQAMLDDIQERKAKRFTLCIEQFDQESGDSSDNTPYQKRGPTVKHNTVR